jgi:hypothetical protein
MSKVGTFCIIARIIGIDVSTYFYISEGRTTYPSGAVEFIPISCVELVFLNPKYSVRYLVYIIVCLLAAALSVL